MVDLYVLDLSKNGLTGKIPKCLWNMSLYVMLLSSNRLSGAIPSPLGPNLSLRWLLLNNNNFNGELPGAFRYFRLLTVFDIGENKISGNIPKWIGKKFTSLIALRLHKNNFTGRIPHSLCKCSDLQILDLAHNNLTGSIPHCFGELNGMKKKSFYTFDSRFSGYGNMTQVIKGVALEYTKTLQTNSKGNQLQTLTDPLMYADNPYLCGAPLPKECSPHENTSKNKDENTNEPNKVWFYLDIACGFATGFWGIIGVLLFKKEWRHKLFMFCEVAMDKIYVVVAVRVLKMKRGREAA
ncbi:hypothetical protein L1987_10776 [Smallanthus sonchifolius]|uniref:Uncharacterized protein n=1 Tax=Smallanthus sonchifolius TaxID=185202 RepID=A0ACB9J9N4_9ASTR|nr:hypothetical protein L1987_10776 [Smallanthus sonchifolius]